MKTGVNLSDLDKRIDHFEAAAAESGKRKLLEHYGDALDGTFQHI